MGNEAAWTAADHRYLRRALELAAQAEAHGEVPVGAVVVVSGEIVGEGANAPISNNDPTAHAEMIAIRQASAKVGNYRLADSTLYVTLEPCVMCTGAILAARIRRLVFAARDIRFGAIRSVFRLADSDLQNHKAEISEGLMAAEAGALLQNFFKGKR
jgi:tRNA(adenine34) deaminase